MERGWRDGQSGGGTGGGGGGRRLSWMGGATMAYRPSICHCRIIIPYRDWHGDTGAVHVNNARTHAYTQESDSVDTPSSV